MFTAVVVLCVVLGIAVLGLSDRLSDANAAYRVLANTIDADEQNVLATLVKYNWRVEQYQARWTVNGESHDSLLTAYRRACKIQQAREEADRAS